MRFKTTYCSVFEDVCRVCSSDRCDSAVERLPSKMLQKSRTSRGIFSEILFILRLVILLYQVLNQILETNRDPEIGSIASAILRDHIDTLERKIA